jgi:hypothetical protein
VTKGLGNLTSAEDFDEALLRQINETYVPRASWFEVTHAVDDESGDSTPSIADSDRDLPRGPADATETPSVNAAGPNAAPDDEDEVVVEEILSHREVTRRGRKPKTPREPAYEFLTRYADGEVSWQPPRVFIDYKGGARGLTDVFENYVQKHSLVIVDAPLK